MNCVPLIIQSKYERKKKNITLETVRLVTYEYSCFLHAYAQFMLIDAAKAHLSIYILVI